MPDTPTKSRSGNGSSVEVGTTVLYQPRENELPMQHAAQQAALVTAWNEDTEQASLAVFLAGAGFFVSRTGVKEGTEDGTFQQVGTQSDTVVAVEHAKEEAEKLAEKQAKEAKDAAARQGKGQTPATPSHTAQTR